MDKIDYKIKPIFRPSEEICKDFAWVHISHLSAADQEKLLFYKDKDNSYFNSLGDEEKLAALAEWQRLFVYNHLDSAYLNTWNIENHVFAFAAYQTEKMVGFITGALNGSNMFTRSLYVLPEYQGCGIGSKLLDNAECAASFVAPNMELFSLDGAVNFYKNRGYKNTMVLGRVMKVKNLPKPVGVIPVFQWSDRLQSRLNVKIDGDLLKQSKYQPIFVYVNEYRKIDGIAMRMKNGKEKIKVNLKQKDLLEKYKFELSNALAESR